MVCWNTSIHLIASGSPLSSFACSSSLSQPSSLLPCFHLLHATQRGCCILLEPVLYTHCVNLLQLLHAGCFDFGDWVLMVYSHIQKLYLIEVFDEQLSSVWVFLDFGFGVLVLISHLCFPCDPWSGWFFRLLGLHGLREAGMDGVFPQ